MCIRDRGKTIFLNDAYERISGISRNILLNSYMDDLVRDGVLSVTLTKDVVRSRKPITLNQTNQNNKNVVITGSPVFDKDGKVVKVITNVRDITELVNLQKELHFEKKRRALLQNSLLEESAGDNVICNSEEMCIRDRVYDKKCTLNISFCFVQHAFYFVHECTAV